MRRRLFAVILLAATSAAAQTSQSASSAKPATGPGRAGLKHCTSIDKQYKTAGNGSLEISPSQLVSLEARSEACLKELFAQLSPDQRTTAGDAFKLYQAINVELVGQMRQRDAAEARALADRETHDRSYRLATLFGRYAELSYRYDRLLDEVNRYMQADEKFRQAVVATALPGTSAPMPITLPGKVEFLNCSDYHVGRFSACWPPDDD